MVIEFVLIELSGQVLVIKWDDSLEKGHKLVINRTSNLKSDLGVTIKSNEDSYKLQQEMREASHNSCTWTTTKWGKKTRSNRVK